MTLGETIWKARRQKGLTQQQLGELLGYKGRTAELMIQHFEHDRREIPRKNLRAISEILEIPLENLIP